MKTDTSYALTIRAPWAASIFLLGKDVENRFWRTKYRGRLFIHAGCRKNPKPSAIDAISVIVGGERLAAAMTHELWLTRGAIIGSVQLVDYVKDGDSRWADQDAWHWLLADPQPMTPIPMPGRLMLWPWDPK